MFLEEIQFNHQPGFSGDAMAMTLNRDTPVETPEWQRGRPAQPVAYVGEAVNGGVLTIRVRFSDGPAGQRVRVRALDADPQTDLDASQGCAALVTNLIVGAARALAGNALGSVAPNEVTFNEFGISFLQTFTLSGHFIRRGVPFTKRETRWRWQYEEGGRWVDIGESRHTVYVLPFAPVAPWNTLTTPRVDALDLAWEWAGGSRTRDEIAQRITRNVNRLPRVSYDPMTMFGGNGSEPFQLTSWLTAMRSGRPFQMNCTDCANAVTSLSNLLGCTLSCGRMNGTINTHTFLPIGGAAAVDSDWIAFNERVFLAWDYHEICWLDDFTSDRVWDATLRLDGDPSEDGRLAIDPVNMPWASRYWPLLVEVPRTRINERLVARRAVI